MKRRGLLLLAMAHLPLATRAGPGRLVEGGFTSALLGEVQRYQLYLPQGYETSGLRYPVLYLLHGRGDDHSAWSRVLPLLDELIASGRLPPLLAVLPDAPSSRRAGYYVDSEHAEGRPVERSFMQELLPHIDTHYRTLPQREARALAGYSMGGYGALRYALAYPQRFSAALVLSPAAYAPLPPRGSSAREFGAFGRGAAPFVEALYRAKNYPALLEAFARQRLRTRLFIAAGDAEYRHPDADDALHDIDLEAHLLFKRAARLPQVDAALRIYGGGHDWGLWLAAFREGAGLALAGLSPPIKQ